MSTLACHGPFDKKNRDYLWVRKEKYSMGCPLMVNLPVPLFHTVTCALDVLRLPGDRNLAVGRNAHRTLPLVLE